MKAFEGLAYQRGVSFLHRLDPRSKMIYLIALSVLSTVVFYTLLPMLVLFISTIPLVALSRIVKKWLTIVRGALIFVIFIFLFNFIGLTWNYLPNILQAPPNVLCNALSLSTAMMLRFLTLVSVFALFFLTTSPDDFAQSMIQLKLPYDYALTFTMAMRFVPMLARETQLIIDAQKSRGLELEKGNFIQRIRNYIPILIPLIISSFKRAEMIADAMESRAFGASKQRTYLYMLKLSSHDFFFISLTLFFTCLAIVLRLLGLLL
ncbi:MAG: hypothetical protein DRJ31_07785 [Candidatus Methanomethylicota archaeon]|uniref:Energy-coupling factor transporter transmembrane protein EcfT n=1 Tax=Thermoproteota archaeon TaxID=2056631 RepID=A0A497ELH4_9CREN|nr:MAG: hypothetical protein DRJ31_07785 [Candidatus Verstraetearchaeota archaeon]RLE49406.1 MAG: hypothetical protein DRJ33_08275 [Candidatus Verstraetearchaeota archaeon]